MPTLKEKTISSLFWKLLERGGNQVVALVVQIVMARLLAPADFGHLAILLVIVNIGNILVQSGLNTALVQSPDITEEDYSTVFWASLGIAIVLYAALFISAPFIAAFYDAPILEPALRVIALILPITAINSVLSASFQRSLSFKKIFKATLGATFSSGALGIVAALLGAGLWALIIQQLANNIVNGLVLAAQREWKLKAGLNRTRALQHFRYGWKILVPTLMETGYDSLSDAIVGKCFGATSLGYLSQGKKYPVALDSMISGTVQPVVFAAISRAQQSLSDVRSITQRTLKTSFFFAAPIMMTFALTANPIIELLLGEQWLPAAPFMQMYCFTSALSSFHAVNYQTYNGLGRSDLFLKMKVITVSYGIVFMCIAVFAVQNIYAVAIAYMLASAISSFVNSFPNRKLIRYSYIEQLLDIAPSIGCAAAGVAVAWPIGFFALHPLVTIVLQWGISLGLYLALAAITKMEAFVYLKSTLLEITRRAQKID